MKRLADRRLGPCSWVGAALLAATLPLRAAAPPEICHSPNQYRLDTAPGGIKPTLAIRLFGLNFRPDFPVRELETLRVHFAEELRKQLSKSGFFGKVFIVPQDEPAEADLVLTGRFADVSLGDSSFNWYHILFPGADERPSLVGVEGEIAIPGSETPASVFGCSTGYTLGTPTGKAKASLDRIAKRLGKAYEEMNDAGREGDFR